MRNLFALAAFLLIVGCISQTAEFKCADGSVVSDASECQAFPAKTIPTTLSAVVSSTSGIATTSSTLKAAVSPTGNIVIDGSFSDWSSIPVLIKDTVGDVDESQPFDGSKPLKEFDIVAIKAARSGDSLYMQIEFAKDIPVLMASNGLDARNIGELYFDADNDEATGGEEFFSDAAGFESVLNLASGVKAGGNWVSGGASLQDIDPSQKIEYFLTYTPKGYDPTSENFKSITDGKWGWLSRDSIDEPGYITFGGKKAEMKVPLSELDIPPSGKVRIVFFESAGGFGKDAMSEASILD